VARPLQLAFVQLPDTQTLAQRITADIPESLYYNDIHGRPDWRRHLTFHLAEEIRAELAGGA
jgi:hypothetical protein